MSPLTLDFLSIYLNLKGREGSGIIQPDSKVEALARKIAHDLQSLKDPSSSDRVIKQVYAADALYTGEYRAVAPALVVGFNAGYRISWQTAIGGTPQGLLETNQKKWSGDHIVDPSVVPGVIFSNRKIFIESPRSLDIALMVLKAAGIGQLKKSGGGRCYKNKDRWGASADKILPHCGAKGIKPVIINYRTA
jgi:predicted AlkP superfamily phosphohydrolase/phosphomutase